MNEEYPTDEIANLIIAFVAAYEKKSPGTSDEEWLRNILADYLPDSTDEIEDFVRELATSAAHFDRLHQEVSEAGKKSDQSGEMWLYQVLMTDSVGNDEDFRRRRLSLLRALMKGNDWLSNKLDNDYHHDDRDDEEDALQLSDITHASHKKTPTVKKTAAETTSNTAINMGLRKSMTTQLQKTMRVDLSHMDTTEITRSITRNAAFAGVGGVAVAASFAVVGYMRNSGASSAVRQQLAKKLFASYLNTSVRTAVAGALKVGAERNMLPLLARGTPAVVILSLSAIGVECAKIFADRMKGNITNLEALDRAGRISVCSVASLSLAGKGATVGAAVGATAFSALPIVGSLVGGVMGGMIGNVVGGKVGNASYQTALSIGNLGYNTARNAGYLSEFIMCDIACGFKRAANYMTHCGIETAKNAQKIFETTRQRVLSDQ